METHPHGGYTQKHSVVTVFAHSVVAVFERVRLVIRLSHMHAVFLWLGHHTFLTESLFVRLLHRKNVCSRISSLCCDLTSGRIAHPRLPQVMIPTQLCRNNKLDMIQWRLEQLSSQTLHSSHNGARGNMLPVLQCKLKAAVTQLHQPRTVVLRTSSRASSVQVLEEADSDKNILHDRKIFYRPKFVDSRNTAQETASLSHQGCKALHHQQAGFEHAAPQYEQSARDQTQGAIDGAIAQQQAGMVAHLHRIEQTIVSEHHTHILTHMNRVAEQRTSLVTETFQALQMRDGSTPTFTPSTINTNCKRRNSAMR